MQIVYAKRVDGKIADWSNAKTEINEDGVEIELPTGLNDCTEPLPINDEELKRFRFKQDEYSI